MSAADDLKKAQDKLADPNFRGTYEFEGKKYSRTALRDTLIPLLEERDKAEKKRKKETEAGFTSLRAQISAQEKLVKDLESTLFADRRAFKKKNLSEAELKASEKRLDDAKKRLTQLTTRQPVPTRRPTTTTTTKSGVGGQRTGAPNVAAETAGFGGKGGTTIVTTKPGGTTTVTTKPTTPVTEKPEAVVTDWETLVSQQAGEYQYLLDPKYEGVPELLRKAVQQGYFKSEEGKKQFLQEFQATGYYRNTSQKQQLFDKKTPADKRAAIGLEIEKIRSEYGEIQFDQATLEEVATAAARNGATAVELGRLVYRAAFKIGAAQPVFGASTAAKTALGGEDVARVRAIYRAYGQKADDQTIARILAGETDPASGVVMTEDMLRNNLRDIAKVSYKPFADLLDRGISVETIFQPYKNLAASVLEKTPDEVELIDASGKPTQFASALMGKDPLSLTEWMTTLKADNKYGWQFTNEAKQKSTGLVMDLEKAFGFRK